MRLDVKLAFTPGGIHVLPSKMRYIDVSGDGDVMEPKAYSARRGAA